MEKVWIDKCKIGPSGLAVTEKLSAGSVTLPLSSKMTVAQFERMAEAVIRIQAHSAEIVKTLTSETVAVGQTK